MADISENEIQFVQSILDGKIENNKKFLRLPDYSVFSGFSLLSTLISVFGISSVSDIIIN